MGVEHCQTGLSARQLHDRAEDGPALLNLVRPKLMPGLGEVTRESQKSPRSADECNVLLTMRAIRQKETHGGAVGFGVVQPKRNS